jgi:hypothetical protein
MLNLNMSMEIRPSHARLIARSVVAVVYQQQSCIAADRLVVLLDAEGVILADDLGGLKVLVALVGVVGETTDSDSVRQWAHSYVRRPRGRLMDVSCCHLRESRNFE